MKITEEKLFKEWLAAVDAMPEAPGRKFTVHDRAGAIGAEGAIFTEGGDHPAAETPRDLAETLRCRMESTEPGTEAHDIAGRGLLAALAARGYGASGDAHAAVLSAFRAGLALGLSFLREHEGAAAHGYKIAAADKSVFPKALRQKHARRFSARLAKWEAAGLSKRECGVLLNAAIKDDKPLARDCAALPGSGRIFPDAKTIRNWILALRSGNL